MHVLVSNKISTIVAKQFLCKPYCIIHETLTPLIKPRETDKKETTMK